MTVPLSWSSPSALTFQNCQGKTKNTGTIDENPQNVITESTQKQDNSVADENQK